MQTPFLPLLIPFALLTVPLAWGSSGCGVGAEGVQVGPQDSAAPWRQHRPSTAQFAQCHASAPAGPHCPPLLHLESSGSFIVVLNINGLVIS